MITSHVECGRRGTTEKQEAWYKERKPAMERNTTLSGVDANTLKEIQRLLRQNRKIQAIVIYRQAKNCQWPPQLTIPSASCRSVAVDGVIGTGRGWGDFSGFGWECLKKAPEGMTWS
jgi:hypothetical protein